MEKCPKCGQRRGKRFCPALDTLICPQCCAEHRLNTIRCPEDCPHLQKEFYQLARREERARTRGKPFLDTLQRLFLTEPSRRFAYHLHSDAFWWMRKSRPLTNEALLVAFERLRELLGAVFVPAERPSPLADFLHALVRQSPRHRELESPQFSESHRHRAVEVLCRHVRGLAPAESLSYYELIFSHFGELDFEADLGYSPAEEIDLKALDPAGKGGVPGFRESRSGLILPDV
jgi:hypothetical protein